MKTERLATMLLAIAWSAAAQAEKVQYLPLSGMSVDHRAIMITTTDGKKHSGRKMTVQVNYLRVFHGANSWEDLPPESVARIEIGQGGRFFHHIVDLVMLPWLLPELFCWTDQPDACVVILRTVNSPMWAFAAASAPVLLAADGASFLIPPKVYEIIH